MDIKMTCPLGSECEVAKDGYIERCRWYVEMRGVDASGKAHDHWECAIAWQPVLMVEASNTNRNVAASVQSLRNSQVRRQDAAIQQIAEVGKTIESQTKKHS